jgi:hypothetical protein
MVEESTKKRIKKWALETGQKKENGEGIKKVVPLPTEQG